MIVTTRETRETQKKKQQPGKLKELKKPRKLRNLGLVLKLGINFYSNISKYNAWLYR